MIPGEDGDINDDGSAPEESAWGLLVPFLGADPAFAYGVEFGMWYQSCRLKSEHGQYVRTENESQMTLTCARLGWSVIECKPWDEGPPENGWVYLKVANPEPIEVGELA